MTAAAGLGGAQPTHPCMVTHHCIQSTIGNDTFGIQDEPPKAQVLQHRTTTCARSGHFSSNMICARCKVSHARQLTNTNKKYVHLRNVLCRFLLPQLPAQTANFFLPLLHLHRHATKHTMLMLNYHYSRMYSSAMVSTCDYHQPSRARAKSSSALQ